MTRIIRKSAVSFVGWFPSIINDCMVWFDSLSTLYRFYYLEFDIDVTGYVSQPFTHKSTAFKGELHSYTPDILVSRITRWLLIECKVEKHLNSEHTQQQIAIGEELAKEKDWEFLVSVKERLLEGCRLWNYRLIYRYARLGIPYPIVENTLSLLRQEPEGMTVEKLSYGLAGNTSMDYSPYIYGLIFRRVILIDWDLKINPHSILTLSY